MESLTRSFLPQAMAVRKPQDWGGWADDGPRCSAKPAMNPRPWRSAVQLKQAGDSLHRTAAAAAAAEADQEEAAADREEQQELEQEDDDEEAQGSEADDGEEEEEEEEDDDNDDLSQALPDEILEKILSSLPIVNILRARVVCRRWGAITASGRFLSLCEEGQDEARHSPWYFMYREAQGSRGLAYDPAAKKWHGFTLPGPEGNWSFAASCHGLLCFSSSSSSSSSSNAPDGFSLYVCNPMMKSKAWRKMPESRGWRSDYYAVSMMATMLDHRAMKRCLLTVVARSAQIQDDYSRWEFRIEVCTTLSSSASSASASTQLLAMDRGMVRSEPCNTSSASLPSSSSAMPSSATYSDRGMLQLKPCNTSTSASMAMTSSMTSTDRGMLQFKPCNNILSPSSASSAMPSSSSSSSSQSVAMSSLSSMAYSSTMPSSQPSTPSWASSSTSLPSASSPWITCINTVLVGWRGGDNSVICNGIFYCVIHSTAMVGASESRHGLLSYNLRTGELEIASTPMPCCLTCVKLINCGEKLIMVGGIGKYDIVRGIGIWELIIAGSGSANGSAATKLRSNKWKEISRMPNKFFRGFGEFDDVFASSGRGDLIYIHAYGSPQLLLFSLKHGSWRWSQKCPMVKKHPLHLFTGFCFEPNLNACP